MTFFDDLPASIAALLVASDYRIAGETELLALCTDGTLCGYAVIKPSSHTHGTGDTIELSTLASISGGNGALGSGVSSPEIADFERQLKALDDERTMLEMELNGYEDNIKLAKSGQSSAALIPPTTKVSYALKQNRNSQCLQLTLSTNHSDTLVIWASVHSDVLFEEHSRLFHPKQPGNSLTIPLRPEKNLSTTITVKCAVGLKHSLQDQIFEMSIQLPKFAMFAGVKSRDLQPRGQAIFPMTERINRALLWLQQHFLLDTPAANPAASNQPGTSTALTQSMQSASSTLTVSSDTLVAAFQHIRDPALSFVLRIGPEQGGQAVVGDLSLSHVAHLTAHSNSHCRFFFSLSISLDSHG